MYYTNLHSRHKLDELMIGKIYNIPDITSILYATCTYIDYNNIHNMCLRFNIITLETY